MRRMVAILLLACLGMLIPVAGTVRICLLEPGFFLGHELQQVENTTASKCCEDCSGGSEDRDLCCLDLEKLPDAPAFHPSFELPPACCFELPFDEALTTLPVRLSSRLIHVYPPVRGPDSPSARRAFLGVWRV